ncbi:MAG: hypothetical protein HC933_20855 [Pleurocapsa sp. SU_196_0]|nr:hypothetical protein [Pleurocapsa sp. SU_196_0]
MRFAADRTGIGTVQAVREVRERSGQAHRTEFVEFLYGTMNSVTSLKQFEVAT